MSAWVFAGEDGLRVRSACASHIGGCGRQEDAVFLNGDVLGHGAAERPQGCESASRRDDSYPCVFAIADGMGGRNAGHRASEICIREVAACHEFMSPDTRLEVAIEQLQGAVARADALMCAEGTEIADYRGMGSTLVVFVACVDGCGILSLGDSRAYLCLEDGISPLTKDDTEGQRLVDLGLMGQEEAASLADKDNLTRFVGQGGDGLVVRCHSRRLDAGDGTVLLCSDGISKSLTDGEISSMLAGVNESSDLERACRDLVMASSGRGDSDNASALLAKVAR